MTVTTVSPYLDRDADDALDHTLAESENAFLLRSEVRLKKKKKKAKKKKTGTRKRKKQRREKKERQKKRKQVIRQSAAERRETGATVTTP